jgi:hypothetical protein
MNIYPLESEKLFNTVVHIFSTILCVDNFDPFSIFFLEVILELLKYIKILFFLPKKVDLSVSRNVINKSEQVASLVEREGWK